MLSYLFLPSPCCCSRCLFPELLQPILLVRRPQLSVIHHTFVWVQRHFWFLKFFYPSSSPWAHSSLPGSCAQSLSLFGSIDLPRWLRWKRTCLPMQEMQVQSLGWEDLLEKDMATHPVFLPGEPHGQRSLVGSSPQGHTVSDMTERRSMHTLLLACCVCRMAWIELTFPAVSLATPNRCPISERCFVPWL